MYHRSRDRAVAGLPPPIGAPCALRGLGFVRRAVPITLPDQAGGDGGQGLVARLFAWKLMRQGSEQSYSVTVQLEQDAYEAAQSSNPGPRWEAERPLFQEWVTPPSRDIDRAAGELAHLSQSSGLSTFGESARSWVLRSRSSTVRADPRVGMTLRVNINHTNVEGVSELLRLFEPDVRKRLRLALEPIFGLYAEAKTLGYQVAAASTGLLTGRLTYCYAERERQHVINYDGNVYKCPADSFDPAHKLAELTKDGRIQSSAGARESWMALGDRFDEVCKECVYLPLCMGGCRIVRAQGPGGTCTLVPSNASYVLKQVALSCYPSSLLENR